MSTVRVFHHGSCCVRVIIIGLRLLYGARFSTANYSPKNSIAFHAFAPLEALARVRPMTFFSGVHFLTGSAVNSTQMLKAQFFLFGLPAPFGHRIFTATNPEDGGKGSDAFPNDD
jgi:hypothetical protein